MRDHQSHQILFGIVTILVTVFAMALTDAIVKLASSDMTLWQIYVLRTLLVAPVLLFLARRTLRPIAFGWVLLRSLALTLMYLGIYAAIPLLDLSVIAASLYTGPLFIVALSALALREPITTRHWAAILIGFLGVLLIVRPAAADFSPFALIPVSAGFLYALAAVITRSRCAAVPAFTLALWLNVTLFALGATASLLIAGFGAGSGIDYPFLFGTWSVTSWPVVILLAVLMIGISIGLARAYQSPKPQVIATFDYAYLPFAGFWGFVFFGEIPDKYTLGGMALIVFAGCVVFCLDGRTKTQKGADIPENRAGSRST